MSAFVIGVVVAVAVVSVYVGLGVRDFLRIRREVARTGGAAGGAGDAVDPARATVGFAWRALGGVGASVALLYAISHVWWAWYAFPALALGTGVAVSVAFVIDPTREDGT